METVWNVKGQTGNSSFSFVNNFFSSNSPTDFNWAEQEVSHKTIIWPCFMTNLAI